MSKYLSIPVGLLLLTALLGLVAATNRTFGLDRLAVYGVGVLALVVTLLAARSPGRLRAAALAVLLAGLAAALLSLVVTDWTIGELSGVFPIAHYFPVLIRLHDSGVPNTAHGANPRMVSGTMAVFLPLAISVLCFARQKRLRWLGGLAVPVMLFPLLLSQSPQGVLALALGVGLILAWRWPRTLALQAALALAAGLSWSAWHWGLPAALVARLDVGVQARLSIWPGAWRMLLDMPFTGSGLNNFPVIYPLYNIYNSVQPHAHNVFLQTGNDLGIFGLAAFLALFAAAFLAGWRAYHASQDPDLRAVALGCAGGCGAFLGYGLWDSMTLGALPAVAVWAMLGILFAGERLAAPAARWKLSPVLRQRILLGIGLLALLAAPLWGSSLLVNLGRAVYNRSQAQAAAPEPALGRQVGGYAGLALRLNPANSRAYLLAGVANLQTGDMAAGRASLESALSLDPTDAVTLYRLGEICHTYGEDAQAVAYWRQAGAGDMLIKRGTDASRANQPVEAGRWFQLAVAAAPEKLQAWLWLGRAQAAQKDWTAAGQTYTDALRRFPAASTGYEELAGMLYTQVKDSSQAGQIVEQGLAKARPPGAQLYYLRSRMGADRGDWAAAESDAAQAIVLSPTTGHYLAWLGDLYLKEKRYPEALAQYDRLAAQASTSDWSWMAHQGKAQVYAAQSNWLAAAAEYRSAITMGLDQKTASTNLAPLYTGLGNALEKAGSQPEAIAAYQQALQYDPSNQSARQRLAALLAK